MGSTSDTITRDLIPKIKALCHVPVTAKIGSANSTKAFAPAPGSQSRSRPVPSRLTPPTIVAIGVSTGGPDALARLLPIFPASFPLPIVVAQHMPPIFTSLLAKRLATKCSLPVREPQSGEILKAGCINGSRRATCT